MEDRMKKRDKFINVLAAVAIAVALWCSSAGAAILIPADLTSDNNTDLVYLKDNGKVYYATDLTACTSTDSSCWTQVGDSGVTGKVFSKIEVGKFDRNSTLDHIVAINESSKPFYANSNTTNSDLETAEWIQISDKSFKLLLAGELDNGTDTSRTEETLAGLNANGYALFSEGNATNWIANSGNASENVWTKINSSKKFATMIAGDFANAGYAQLVGINAVGYALYCTESRDQWEAAATPSTTNFKKINGTKAFSKIIAADVDENAGVDLIGLNLANGKPMYCSGNGSAWEAATTPSTTNCMRIGNKALANIAAGDFDHDGYDELVGRNTSGVAQFCTDNATAWEAHRTSPSTTNWKKKGSTSVKLTGKIAVGNLDSDYDFFGSVNQAKTKVKYAEGNATCIDDLQWNNDTSPWTTIKLP